MMNSSRLTPRPATLQAQRGGFAIGLVVGLLVGLALALGVALYVTKVPIPFVNKVPQRTAEQDAAEIEKNKNWDPNAPLSGKNPARPAPAVAPTLPPANATGATSPMAPTNPAAVAVDGTPSRAASAATKRDAPATALVDKPGAKPPAPGAASGLGDPFNYFVQAGAYARADDAEQQRARLAMMGFEARLSEREQSGRTVYRVRLGPFERKDDADSTRDRLTGAGFDASMVRVQK
ncbi:MAG: SPOR domain-containing protein [Burkholderiaceae bacterium]